MDSDSILGIVLLVVLVAVIGAIAFFSIRAERRLQQGLQDLADAKGWQLEKRKRVLGSSVSRGSGARGAEFGFTPGGGGDWSLDVRRRYSRRSGGKGSARITDAGRAEFRAPSPALSGGLAIFATGGAGGALGMAQGRIASSLAGVFDNMAGRALLGQLLGPDMGDHVGQLQSFPAPEGSGVTVMATADPSLWFDVEAIGRELGSWQPARSSDGSPQLAIGEAGIRLFLPNEITDPAALTRFVELGQRLRQVAQRRAG